MIGWLVVVGTFVVLLALGLVLACARRSSELSREEEDLAAQFEDELRSHLAERERDG